MKLSFLFLAALTTLPFAVACTASTDEAPASDDVAEDEVVAARVTPGSFTLYNDANVTPNPSCDPHTKLVLTADKTSKAHLEEGLNGFCEIAIFPNPRDYRLRQTSTDCGSKIFTGSAKRGTERWSIKITDNRTRLCEDVIPALIVVEETRQGSPGANILYSHDKPPAGEELTVEGKLASVMGIGGETTGFAVLSPEGNYELILDNGEQNQFVDGQKARVRGDLTLLSGVETHNRRAIDVKEMLVCPAPGSVNCMPGPNRRLSNLCESGNRSWVSANCTGVQYLD